jgi:hypothetical protein
VTPASPEPIDSWKPVMTASLIALYPAVIIRVCVWGGGGLVLDRRDLEFLNPSFSHAPDPTG